MQALSIPPAERNNISSARVLCLFPPRSVHEKFLTQFVNAIVENMGNGKIITTADVV